MNRNAIACPHCHGRVRTLTSRALSALVREIYFDCVDVTCAHRFVAQLGIVRTLTPSLRPCAEITLPLVEHRANDITMPPPAPGPVRPAGSTSQPR
jgi:hypothetical protein